MVSNFKSITHESYNHKIISQCRIVNEEKKMELRGKLNGSILDMDAFDNSCQTSCMNNPAKLWVTQAAITEVLHLDLPGCCSLPTNLNLSHEVLDISYHWLPVRRTFRH